LLLAATSGVGVLICCDAAGVGVLTFCGTSGVIATLTGTSGVCDGIVMARGVVSYSKDACGSPPYGTSIPVTLGSPKSLSVYVRSTGSGKNYSGAACVAEGFSTSKNGYYGGIEAVDAFSGGREPGTGVLSVYSLEEGSL